MDPTAQRGGNLEVGHLFRRGWAVFRDNLGTVMGAFLVYLLLTNLALPFEQGSRIGHLLSLVSLFLTAPMMVGIYALYLKLVRGQTAEVADVLSGFQQLGRALGVFWLQSIAIGIGLILLIVPGVIVGLGLFPALFLVMDSDLGVVDCLRRAWEMTEGRKPQLFVLVLAIIGLMLLGAVALVIGIFFAMPLSLVISAVTYDELCRAHAPAPSTADLASRPDPLV